MSRAPESCTGATHPSPRAQDRLVEPCRALAARCFAGCLARWLALGVLAAGCNGKVTDVGPEPSVSTGGHAGAQPSGGSGGTGGTGALGAGAAATGGGATTADGGGASALDGGTVASPSWPSGYLEAPVNVPGRCSGGDSTMCPAGAFCDSYYTDVCGYTANAPVSGGCMKIPSRCSDVCPGVCGCDHKFYCNTCLANQSRTDLAGPAPASGTCP